MQRSMQRILTTHTGSLPRPDELRPLLIAREAHESYDEAALEKAVQIATHAVVRQQLDAGIDVVNAAIYCPDQQERPSSCSKT